MHSSESSVVILPEGTNLYSHQVAGHVYDGKTKLGVLKHKNGSIIKPVKDNDHRAERELLFYENVFSNKESDPILTELVSFLPKFRDTCLLKIGEKETKCLCLEDVCETFKKPSILDIKMGGKTYDPEANEAKIEYEKSKYLYSEVVGFRILGMKIYCNDTDLYVNKDKTFGKQIIPEKMKSVLEQMLTSNPFINCLILCGLLHKLTALANWFKRQRKYAFYSSSLLIVYEGTLSLWYKWISKSLHHLCEVKGHIEDSSTTVRINIHENLLNAAQCPTCLLRKNLCHNVISNCDLIRVTIIDCAHVFSTSEEDFNYKFGLENLIKYIQSMLNDQEKLAFINK